MDLPGPQCREGDRQPRRYGARVGDLPGRALPAQVQIRGQLLGRELPHRRRARQARHPRIGITGIHTPDTATAARGASGSGIGGWGGTAGVGAGGELADRGQLGPGRERPDPPDRDNDPGQVVIGQRGQDLLIGGGGVHEGRQDRAGVHLVRGAVLPEPRPGDIPGRQLLPRDRRGHQLGEVGRAVLFLVPGPRGFGGAVVPTRRDRLRTRADWPRAGARRPGAGWLGGVRVGVGERGGGHAPPLVREKEGSRLGNKNTSFRAFVRDLGEPFFDHPAGAVARVPRSGRRRRR